MGNKSVTMATNVLYNCWISDVMTCHKAMSTELFRSLRLRERGFAIEPEIAARVLQSGERIFEVPIGYAARSRDEGKKLTAFDGDPRAAHARALQVRLASLRRRSACRSAAVAAGQANAETAFSLAAAPRRSAEAGVAEEPHERGTQRGDVAGRHDEARDAVLDRVGEAADAGRHDGPAVRHRLARDDAVSLAARRHADDGRPLVVRAELVVRDEADRLGHEVAQRAVADDDERQARAPPRTSSRMPFSSESRPT